MGSATAEASALANLNELAGVLGSDLQLNGTAVTERRNYLDNNAELPTTGEFEKRVDLFGPFT